MSIGRIDINEKDLGKICTAIIQLQERTDPITDFITTLLNDPDAATARATLGVSTTTANGWEFLSTQTVAAAATIDITANLTSTYDHYVLMLNLTFSSSGAALLFQISQDSGATFKSGATDYKYVNSVFLDDSTQTILGSGAGATTVALTGSALSNNAGTPLVGRLFISNLASTSVSKDISWDLASYLLSSVGKYARFIGSGAYAADAAAINSLRFVPSAGTVTGTVVLFGIRKT
jgi:hypothetical protein